MHFFIASRHDTVISLSIRAFYTLESEGLAHVKCTAKSENIREVAGQVQLPATVSWIYTTEQARKYPVRETTWHPANNRSTYS